MAAWYDYPMNIIEPKILKGTRDFGPTEMAKRLFVLNQIRSVFERYGYDTIETPAIEYAETILGKYGDEGDKLTYTFKDKGGREIALRYDQTVPTARFVAANWGQLAFPFKRYQIGPVWRADKPQKGRYREFVQCDIDIVGSDSLLADVEIAKVIYDVFTTLGFDNFVIRVNSRKLLDEILDLCKVKKLDRINVIRIMDKLDKVPLAKIKKELAKILSKKQVEQLSKLALSEKARNDLDGLPDLKSKKVFKELFKLYKSWGIPDKNIMLDLTLARGLDYYTGITYEVIIPGSSLGSLCGGGRYDDLTGLFTDKKFPGTGVAFGFDRMMLWLEENSKLDDVALASQVLIVNFASTLKQNLATLKQLQKAGINAELYLEPAKLNKQLKYANKKQIPWVIIQGPDEVKSKKIMLRNMQSGEQETTTLKEAIKISLL